MRRRRGVPPLHKTCQIALLTRRVSARAGSRVLVSSAMRRAGDFVHDLLHLFRLEAEAAQHQPHIGCWHARLAEIARTLAASFEARGGRAVVRVR